MRPGLCVWLEGALCSLNELLVLQMHGLLCPGRSKNGCFTLFDFCGSICCFFGNLSCLLCSGLCVVMQNHLFPPVFDLILQLYIKWSLRNVIVRLFSLKY